jgi:hypothetical protein
MKLKYKIAISLRYRSIEFSNVQKVTNKMVLTVLIIIHQLVVNRNDFFIEALLRKNAYVAVLFFV